MHSYLEWINIINITLDLFCINIVEKKVACHWEAVKLHFCVTCISKTRENNVQNLNGNFCMLSFANWKNGDWNYPLATYYDKLCNLLWQALWNLLTQSMRVHWHPEKRINNDERIIWYLQFIFSGISYHFLKYFFCKNMSIEDK